MGQADLQLNNNAEHLIQYATFSFTQNFTMKLSATRKY